MFISVNPATGQRIAEYDTQSFAEIEREVLPSLVRSQVEWSRESLDTRRAGLQLLAEKLEQRTDDFGRLMSEEMGKPITQAKAEIKKCADLCRYFSAQASEIFTDKQVYTSNQASGSEEAFISFQPLGVLLAIMPWNFPFWQVFRVAVPNLLAGNVLLLKHAPNVTTCALAIERLFDEVREGILEVIRLEHSEMEALIAHPAVSAVTLTGSVRAGREVAALAGRYLKKTVLELGGSDPYVVLDDADVELAAEVCVASRFNNCGQTCIAAKRLIVVKKLMPVFQQVFLEKVKAKKLGDPLDKNTDIGPMARLDLRESLHRQVVQSAASGAEVLLGAELPSGRGAFYPPSVLTAVRPEMTCFREELFGPVAVLIQAASEAEALQLANDTNYGLGAAIFSKDVSRAKRLAREKLQAGSCAVNGVVRSDPRLPFGGIKESGYGRELGEFGALEFVNIKSLVVHDIS